MKRICLLTLLLFAAPCLAADLSGNWAVRDPLPDGTERTTYLNLKQDGSRITGTIRVTQFFYKIVDSSGGPDTFTLTAGMMDGHTELRVTYQISLTGDDLHVATHRRQDNQLVEMVAHRAPRQRRGYTPRASSGNKRYENGKSDTEKNTRLGGSDPTFSAFSRPKSSWGSLPPVTQEA
jgi:hypothetical protein